MASNVWGTKNLVHPGYLQEIAALEFRLMEAYVLTMFRLAPKTSFLSLVGFVLGLIAVLGTGIAMSVNLEDLVSSFYALLCG